MDPESHLTFTKEAVLLFTELTSRGREKAKMHCGLPVIAWGWKVPSQHVACETLEVQRRGGARPRSHSTSFFLALISFSFHNSVLSAKL